MRLLIVEDEPRLLSALAEITREAGYAVDTAGTGKDALDKALAWDYDAVILDVMLPVLDGWQVLTHLRQKKQTPVLVLTACDRPEERVFGLDRGADDFLVKPFELSELLARIRALIRRTAGSADSRIALNGVCIDTAARTVLRDDQTVALTAKEYALLEYLALHRGKVFTRNQICEHIFDERSDSLSNLVDVHVFNIRRKLGRDIIVTRRGMGYLISS